jgi:hypothetical protein
MEVFMLGAISMAPFIAALFFLRFWRDTGDRLFAIFAAAFSLLGATRLGLAMVSNEHEWHTIWYWVRLAAFVLILIAIIDKNRR